MSVQVAPPSWLTMARPWAEPVYMMLGLARPTPIALRTSEPDVGETPFVRSSVPAGAVQLFPRSVLVNSRQVPKYRTSCTPSLVNGAMKEILGPELGSPNITFEPIVLSNLSPFAVNR